MLLPEPRRLLELARRRPGSSSSRREAGIALVVVFILVIILYLVVFQLEYTTKMEEELAEVRTTESSISSAVTSVASYTMSLLAEDAQADQGEVQEAGMAGAVPDASGAGAGAGGAPAGGPGAAAAPQGAGGATLSQAPPPGLDEEEMRQWLAQQGAAAGVAPGQQESGTLDYILENIFLPTSQSINGVEVKILIIDNARAFDLNRLWEYPREQIQSLTEEQRQAEFDQAVATIDDLNRQALENPAEDPTLDLNSSRKEWVPPTESQRELVREMLTRAIDLMYRMNAEAGFQYELQPAAPSMIATFIEDYCYQKRAQPFHNSVAMTSELLAHPDVTPEVFYGPNPRILPDEEYFDSTGDFRYTRDEFGDLVGEYLLVNPEYEQYRMEQQQDLEMLQAQYGAYASFPEVGGLLGNSLTRNMSDLPENYDATGIAVAPMPIGLRDIFTTVSSGKINLNTAPRPVIYGLLLSLPEEEAEMVAYNLEAYRHEYQEEEPEEGIESDSTVKDYGQPRRQVPTEEELEDELEDPELMAGGTGYQDYETNYFTDLRQIVLIDGQEGGSEDFLTDEDGVDIIDEDYQSPLQLVTHDLQNSITFGSSYFTVRLKIRSQDSPVVKSGELLIHRDTRGGRMEVIQWKEHER